MSDREQREEALRRRMQELAAQFLTRTQGEVATIQAMLAPGAAQPAVPESVAMMAHKICGTASTFQFDEISACAGELERVSGELAAALAGAPLEDRQVTRLASIAARLASALHGARQTKPDAA